MRLFDLCKNIHYLFITLLNVIANYHLFKHSKTDEVESPPLDAFYTPKEENITTDVHSDMRIQNAADQKD